jgi:hypothetical protein
MPECNAKPGSLILVPPAQPEPLSSAIVRQVADERERSAFQGAVRRTVAQHCTDEKQTAVILDVLGRVMGTRTQKQHEGAVWQ